jgi:metallophosphoesterase (TIGR03767 family)
MLGDATANFRATGLRIPWYSGPGNHDGEQYGTFATSRSFFDWITALGTGTLPGHPGAMMLDIPKSMGLIEFALAFGLGDVAKLNQAVAEAPKRTVPSNPNRALYTMHEFIQMHLDSPASPGPVGHGYTPANLANNTWYYTFDLSPQVLGIMLDTVNQGGGVGGSIGDKQLRWLEEQIQGVSSRYYDANGNVVRTQNPNRLVVLFSHHNLMTMDNFLPDPYDPIRHLAAKIISTLQRYPNVILWVNGHSHFNRVWAHVDESGQSGGFWEVNTASHIDYPQQSRTIEITDNQDGTLSIFGILFDHAAPPVPPPSAPYSHLDLASISRELSANDPAHQVPVQIGVESDRNVELVIQKPF